MKKRKLSLHRFYTASLLLGSLFVLHCPNNPDPMTDPNQPDPMPMPMPMPKQPKPQAAFSDAAFSQTGRIVITGQEDGTVGLWDENGKQQSSFQAHNAAVSDVASTEKYLLTVSADQTARLWDTKTHCLLKTLSGWNGTILSSSFSEDLKYVLLVSQQGSAFLWNTETGTFIADLAQKAKEQMKANSRIVAAQFYKDSILVVHEKEGILYWENLNSPKYRGMTSFSEGTPVIAASFSSYGSILTWVSNDNKLNIMKFPVGSGLIVQDKLGAKAEALFASPDGKSILTVHQDKSMRLWESETGLPLQTWPSQPNTFHRISFSADSSTFLSTDGSVKRWDTYSKPKFTFIGGSPVISADGKYAVTITDKATLWNTETGVGIPLVQNRNDTTPNHALFSPTGKEVLLIWNDKIDPEYPSYPTDYFEIWEVAPTTLRFGMNVASRILDFSSKGDISFLPGSDFLLVIQKESTNITIQVALVDAKTGSKYTLNYTSKKWLPVLSADGKVMVYAKPNTDGSMVTIYQTKVNQWASTKKLGDYVDSGLIKIQTSLTGQFVSIQTTSGINLYDTSTTPATITPYVNYTASQFSADGKHFVAFKDAGVTQLNLETNASQYHPAPGTTKYLKATFSSQGGYVAMEKNDGKTALLKPPPSTAGILLDGVNPSFSADGFYLSTTDDRLKSAATYVWETKQPQNGKKTLWGQSPAEKTPPLFTADHQYLVTMGSLGSFIRLWNIQKEEFVASFDHSGSILLQGMSAITSGLFSIDVWQNPPVKTPLLFVPTKEPEAACQPSS